jgi:hypothetical protein
MRKLYALIVIMTWIQCDNSSTNVSNAHSQQKVQDLPKEEELVSNTVPMATIKANSFKLPTAGELKVAIDSQKIITKINSDRHEYGALYIMRPKSKAIYDSINLDKFFNSVASDILYKYNFETVELLTNNENKIKVLLHGTQKTSGSTKYVVSNFNRITNTVLSEATSKEFLISDVSQVYFDNGFILITDSVRYLYDLTNFKLFVDSGKRRLYSVIDTAGRVYTVLSAKAQVNQKNFRIVSVLPKFGNIFFSGYNKVREETVLISYNVYTTKKIKYSFPLIATQFWFSKNCIFFSYQTRETSSADHEVRYSYIPY